VIWRDIKVYDDHAFIVSEAREHGMQVFDLTQLRTIERRQAPVELTETAHYSGFGRAHNVGINEDTGYAYVVGAREDLHGCAGGLHMVDVRQPASPTFAGCVAEDGYVHDTQCVVYDGPDARFTGREICFNSNEDTLTIVDVTVKANPVELSRVGYSSAAYSHQGWLTDDRGYFLMGDELDELRSGVRTTTLIWDVSDLTAPSSSPGSSTTPPRSTTTCTSTATGSTSPTTAPGCGSSTRQASPTVSCARSAGSTPGRKTTRRPSATARGATTRTSTTVSSSCTGTTDCSCCGQRAPPDDQMRH